MQLLTKIVKIVAAIIGGLILIALFSVGIGYILTAGDYSMAKTVAQDPSIPHIEIKNYRFHSEAFGDKNNPVIVTLAGGPGNSYRYILPLKALANEYYVIFYDQRGTGLSPRVPAQQLTLDSSIADLNDIINHYAGDRNIILIGHSWGGMLAAAYLGRYPGRVNKAVLAEPGILSNESAEVFIKRMYSFPGFSFLFHYFKSWLKSLHVQGPDEQAAKDFFMTEALMRYRGTDSPLADYYCNGSIPEHALKEWRFGAVASEAIMQDGYDEKGNLRMNLAAGVEKYKKKVLVIASECNSFVGVEWQKEYHLKLFPQAELQVIKNSGHAMFGEQPEESLRVIREYLNE